MFTSVTENEYEFITYCNGIHEQHFASLQLYWDASNGLPPETTFPAQLISTQADKKLIST